MLVFDVYLLGGLVKIYANYKLYIKKYRHNHHVCAVDTTDNERVCCLARKRSTNEKYGDILHAISRICERIQKQYCS